MTVAVSSFEDAFRRAREVEGWLTDAQARRLWDRTVEAGPGARVVEIGSFRGRSTIVLAHATHGGSVVAIDPHGGTDRGPREITTSVAHGERDAAAFRRNLERAGVAELVEHVRLPSQEALSSVGGSADLLYVDGAHRYRPARDDIARWGLRVRPGGTMLVHDAFSSIGVTLALVRTMFLGSAFAYTGRTRSLAEYRRAELRGSERVRNLMRQVSELPWFARNLLMKIALVMRLRSGDWPY